MPPPLDEHFRPAALANHRFLEGVKQSGSACRLRIALERAEGETSVFDSFVYPAGHRLADANCAFAERLVKTLLWQKGGWRIVVGGPAEVGEHIRSTYSPSGARAFDAQLMGNVFERPFKVELAKAEEIPDATERSVPLGRHLDGCRIGFDAGASDRKVAAVVEGKVVFSEEVPWDPKNQSDPEYHYRGITAALRSAAEHMPRVDTIGVSAAGIYLNNRVKVASLFRSVPNDVFQEKVTGLFLRIKRDWDEVALEVLNDGDVTALAGSMSLGENGVLGISMGSSEAGGYVNEKGEITGWLNELAFVPVDLSPQAPVDEWSGDRGCGSQYFSQEAAVRLARGAGIPLDETKSRAEQLEAVQEALAAGEERAARVFESIGCYTGHGIAHYADFYDIRHVLVLGRVTSGEGGNIILRVAQQVLREEFPDLAQRISLHLPDESGRRVGQAIAAASLPRIGERN